MSLIYADEQGTRINMVYLTSKIEGVSAGLTDNNESISSQALEVTMLLECIDQYRDYKSILLSYQESAPTAKHRFVKALERCADVTSERADMMQLFEHCCKILDAIDYGNDYADSIKYNECKEYVEQTLPLTFINREDAVDVFAKAMVQGLLEKAEHKQGKGLRRTDRLPKALLAYLCGRLFCGDSIQMTNRYDRKKVWHNGGELQGATELKVYFGEDIRGIRQSYVQASADKLQKSAPKHYEVIDALFYKQHKQLHQAHQSTYFHNI